MPCGVFPARAGVILIVIFQIHKMAGIPRASGGDPNDWPCFRFLFWVFPARAGVILRLFEIITNWGCIPRASGGDPSSYKTSVIDGKYSPRERG